MVVGPATAVVTAVIALAWQLLARSSFQPNACNTVEPYLYSQIVGQDLAVGQLIDAVCHYTALKDHPKPLVISVHGPPGWFATHKVSLDYVHVVLLHTISQLRVHDLSSIDIPKQISHPF